MQPNCTMNNAAGVFLETGTTYSSRAPEFTPGFFCGVRVAHLFIMLCCKLQGEGVYNVVITCARSHCLYESNKICLIHNSSFQIFYVVCVRFVCLFVCLSSFLLLCSMLPVSLDCSFIDLHIRFSLTFILHCYDFCY